MTTEYPRVTRTSKCNDYIEIRYIEVAPEVVVRGLFARVDIPVDTLIEEAPVIPIYADEKPVRMILVSNYAYEWKLRNEDGELVTRRAIALGFGSVYNHNDVDPTVDHYNYHDEFRIEFYTARDVKAGEELTHDYRWGKSPKSIGSRLNPVDKYLRPITNRHLPEEFKMESWQSGIISEDESE